jgi:hypothetical protein
MTKLTSATLPVKAEAAASKQLEEAENCLRQIYMVGASAMNSNKSLSKEDAQFIAYLILQHFRQYPTE